jgi:hypothetical protein
MPLRKIVLAALVITCSWADVATACGDKFLIVGRGSRFQRAYVALHPASLLVVDANVTAQRDVQSRLKIAGHRLQIAKIDQLPQTLASGHYDFILADFHDVERVSRSLPRELSSAMILPVIDGSSKDDMAAAALQYKCLLQEAHGMKAARHFLAALDLAMESKRKSTVLQCNVQGDTQ